MALIDRNRAHLQPRVAVDAYEGPLVGLLDYRLNAKKHAAELGYWTDAAHQGKGIVSQACRVMVQHAFEEHQVGKVEISCAADNVRSRAVAERLGFTGEGTLRRAGWFRDRYVDGVWYGPLASEWQERGAP